ncbi:MAG: hypothetical protein ACJ71Q_14580 [Terriglobales bacterium]
MRDSQAVPLFPAFSSQADEAPHFFEIRDIEDNVIEICEES